MWHRRVVSNWTAIGIFATAFVGLMISVVAGRAAAFWVLGNDAGEDHRTGEVPTAQPDIGDGSEVSIGRGLPRHVRRYVVLKRAAGERPVWAFAYWLGRALTIGGLLALIGAGLLGY
jgi:hypothetical protein